MKITNITHASDVATKTKKMINACIIPSMRLKNAGKPNGFTSDKKDSLLWIKRICGHHR